jgi:hypothetical protein
MKTVEHPQLDEERILPKISFKLRVTATHADFRYIVGREAIEPAMSTAW